jgi:hypothetical protein
VAHVISTTVSTISVSRSPSPKKAGPAEPVLKLTNNFETERPLQAGSSVPKNIHVRRKPHKEHLI